MLEKLRGIKQRYEELSARLSAVDAMADKDVWRDMVKEHAALEEIVAVFDQYQAALDAQDDCRAMLEEHPDAELKELVHAELAELEKKQGALEERLHVLLLPRDPNDEKDVIVEIRAGTGGDEASLFGADLLRMYLRYAERNGYTTEFIESNMTDKGGYRPRACRRAKARPP